MKSKIKIGRETALDNGGWRTALGLMDYREPCVADSFCVLVLYGHLSQGPKHQTSFLSNVRIDSRVAMK